MNKVPSDESTAGTAQPLPLQPSSPEVTPPELRKQQPDVVPVEPPVIVWRSLMLEQ
jgi:hypothetical protein